MRDDEQLILYFQSVLFLLEKEDKIKSMILPLVLLSPQDYKIMESIIEEFKNNKETTLLKIIKHHNKEFDYFLSSFDDYLFGVLSLEKLKSEFNLFLNNYNQLLEKKDNKIRIRFRKLILLLVYAPYIISLSIVVYYIHFIWSLIYE